MLKIIASALFLLYFAVSASAGQVPYRACFPESVALEIAEVLRTSGEDKSEAEELFFSHVRAGTCRTGYISESKVVRVSRNSLIYRKKSVIGEGVTVYRAFFTEGDEANFGSMYFIMLTYGSATGAGDRV